MNRTNPYAADATGRSTGETIMTACVVTVLFTPMKTPATITATTSTVCEFTKIAITAAAR